MFKLSRQQKDHRYFCGNRYEKYSIKKLKVGAASVLIGAGFLFGHNVDTVEAASATGTTEAVVKKDDDTGLNQAQGNTQAGTVSEPKAELAEQPKSNAELEKSVEPAKPVKENEKEAEQASAVSEHTNTAEATETKPSVDFSLLQAKLADLEAQIERIRGNKKQASQIQNAEKLVAEAKQYLSALDATQSGADKKAKEIKSLTFILKSIKAEETVKPKKNSNSRNGKKIQEGTGFRADTPAGTGVGADVVDATSTPAAARDESVYTKREDAEALTKQVTWLDFGDTSHWENVDIEGGDIYLKEGSIYKKEVIPGYIVTIKVKSLKPFQATEIYKKRMEAANATEEEKATFDPNATNQYFGDRINVGYARVKATPQSWSEIQNNGVNTGNKKTAIGAERSFANMGIQFEISGTYKGNKVSPAVLMGDAESANHGESIVLTTNGSPWERAVEIKKDKFIPRPFTPTPYKPINFYDLKHSDYPQSADGTNANQLNAYTRNGLVTLSDGKKIAPKYLTSPDQKNGGLGSGVFGPVVSSGGYSVPVLMTKNSKQAEPANS